MRSEAAVHSRRRRKSAGVAMAGLAMLVSAGIALPQEAGAATGTNSTVAGSKPPAVGRIRPGAAATVIEHGSLRV